MATVCGQSVLACRLRATLLDSDGAVADVENNSWVTDTLVSIGIAHEISEGPDLERRNGCNCIIATAKFPNLRKRSNLVVNIASIEAGLLSMLTGQPVILDGADVIGIDLSPQVDCEEPPPLIALEAWTDNWDSDQQSTSLPWWHWVWPATQWQIGDTDLNTEFAPVVLNGFSRPNGLWGVGPYGDGPDANIGGDQAMFASAEALPVAECGYQTVAPSS